MKLQNRNPNPRKELFIYSKFYVAGFAVSLYCLCIVFVWFVCYI